MFIGAFVLKNSNCLEQQSVALQGAKVVRVYRGAINIGPSGTNTLLTPSSLVILFPANPVPAQPV